MPCCKRKKAMTATTDAIPRIPPWQLAALLYCRQAHPKKIGMALGKGFYIASDCSCTDFPSSSTNFGSSQGRLEIGSKIQFGSLLVNWQVRLQYLGKKKSVGVWLYYAALLFGRAVWWEVSQWQSYCKDLINPLPNSLLCILLDWRLYCRSRSQWTGTLG